MKKLIPVLTLCCILAIGLSACQNVPTQTAPLPEDELQTLVAGTLTAVAYNVGQTQTMGVTPTDTSTPTATVPPATETPTNTPTPEAVKLTLTGSSNCREGASTYFPVITTFPSGAILEVIAVNPAGDYFFVKAPDAPAGGCWVWKEFTSVAGDVSFLPVFTPIPTPRPTATSTPPPAPVFTVKFSGLTACGTGWASNFTITNTGALTLKSIRIRNYVDGIEDPYVHTSNSFVQWSAGAKYEVLADLGKGVSKIVSTCEPGGFDFDPTGKEISAEVMICSAEDLKGTCSTESLDYIPH